MPEREIVAAEVEREVSAVERVAREYVEEDGEAHALGGLRACVGDGELRPAVEEGEGPPVALAYEDVLAARARHHRRKLRVSERARETQEPCGYPRDDDEARRLDVAHHHACLQENPCADDAPYDNRDRREDAEAAD